MFGFSTCLNLLFYFSIDSEYGQDKVVLIIGSPQTPTNT